MNEAQIVLNPRKDLLLEKVQVNQSDPVLKILKVNLVCLKRLICTLLILIIIWN